MKLEHYSKNKQFIKDMQTLTYEQRRLMTRNGAYQLHGPNPVKGKERKRILALLYGIEMSIMEQAERDPIIRCKAEIDFQRIKLGALLEETA
jgi:hypothetical protein